MAAKIKEGLRDIKDSVVSKFTSPKYHDNLLGESLQDQLRKATAKTVTALDPEHCQQIVDTINQDVAGGKDSKDIVGILKKRLRTEHPQKQLLMVQLMARIMRDCAQSLGLHQEELLQEVARVMARPARPETETGKACRQAAKELLRSYGRAGTSAFRAVAHVGGGGATGAAAHGAGGALGATEQESVVAEVKMLIEQAKANTELLGEMLVVGQGGDRPPGSGPDEFEKELVTDLVQQVRELRELFGAYLEQMQSMQGAEVEALMVEALQAQDELDGVMALQKDVASNQDIDAFSSPGGAPKAAAAAPPPAVTRDLISLDDLAEALPASVASPGSAGGAAAAAGSSTSAGGTSPGADPFAASVHHHFVPPQAAAAAAAAPQPQPAPPPLYNQPPFPVHGAAAYPAAVAVPGGPMASPYGTVPLVAALPGVGYSPAPGAPGGAPMGVVGPPPAPYAYSGPGAFSPPAAAPVAYSAPGGAYPVQASNNPFAAAMPVPAAAAPLYPAASHGSGGGAVSSNNPFAAPAAPAAYPAPALPSVTSPSGPAPSGTSVDAEWEMFFAGRAAPAAPAAAAGAPGSQTAQQAAQEFDALVAGRR